MAWLGRFTASLRWQDLERDRGMVGMEMDGVELQPGPAPGVGFAARSGGACRRRGRGRVGRCRVGRRAQCLLLPPPRPDPALFPDTLPCLDALQAHYRLGLLSNGSRLPEKVGLGQYFESVVFAQDHLVAKPDKGIFEVVERQLGVEPAACVLVGDHPLNDVVGAKRGGWRAVWIDRDGRGAFEPHPGCEERPDAVVGMLDELPGVLDRLDRD